MKLKSPAERPNALRPVRKESVDSADLPETIAEQILDEALEQAPCTTLFALTGVAIGGLSKSPRGPLVGLILCGIFGHACDQRLRRPE